MPITIVSDTNEEEDGSIIVTLITDSNPISYTTASAPNNTALLTIYDDDSPPTVSVALDSGEVSEGVGTAIFKLSATSLSGTETVTINATPLEDGHDFLTDTIANTAVNLPVEFTDPDGDSTYEGDFSISLDEDGIGEPRGEIKLRLNANPTVYRLGSTAEGRITILDNDLPELEITAGLPIIEAKNATADFTVTANFSPNKRITLRYDLSESQDFIDNEGTGKTANLDFSNGATSATLPIAIVNDNTIEDDGEIIVRLADDTANPPAYSVNPSQNNFAVFSVSDNDTLPLITMTADSGDVIESDGTANFPLTVTGLTATTTLTINATPDEDGGDFLTDAIAGTATDYPVEFTDPDGDNTYSGTIPITLDNDTTGEATGDIKLTLNVNPLIYRLDTISESVITVKDDDAPVLKIAAGETVIEADNATANFTVSAEISPNDYVTVRFDLAESGNFINNEGTGKSRSLKFHQWCPQSYTTNYTSQ